MSIRNKILLVVCPTIILSVGIATYVTSMKAADTARQLSHEVARETAYRYALQVKAELEQAMEDARMLALAFRELKKEGKASREVLDDILVEALRHDPDLHGVWMLWEPNAYDKLDEKYAGTEGHDETGRVNSWWHYAPGGAVVNDLNEGWEERGWYTIPRERRGEVLYGPYIPQSPIPKKELMVIEAIQPIMIEGRFLGVAGAEYRLSLLQEKLQEMRVFGSGYSTVIANNGKHVAHPDRNLVGKQLEASPESEKMMAAIRAGRSHEQTIAFDEFAGDGVFRVCSPIIIGETGTPWGLVVNIPDKVVTASAAEVRNWILALGGISGLAIIAFLTIIIDRFVKPLVRMTDKLTETVRLDTGRLPELAVASRDEVGRLAFSFNKMAHALNKSRDALRVNEERLRTLITSIPGAVYRCKATYPWRMMFLSDEAEALTGHQNEELLHGNKRDFGEIILPEDREFLSNVIARHIEMRETFAVEYRIRREDGGIRFVHQRGRAIFDEQGSVMWLDGVIVDVTERKQAEKRIRELNSELKQRVDELETKNAELERFTYTVSHDLKAPLITIRGYAGLLENDLQDGNIDEVDKNLNRISRAADQMAQLLRDTLELSRIGRIIGPSTDVAVSDLVAEAVELAAGPIVQRGVEVKIASELPVVRATASGCSKSSRISSTMPLSIWAINQTHKSKSARKSATGKRPLRQG